VLRGLHFQHPQPQGKLVSVTRGTAFDVAVDIRIGSPCFGRWIAVRLSSDNGRQLYVPPDFAHGFLALSDPVDLLYQCTAPYLPAAERTLRWDDPDVGIDWPQEQPLLSDKDALGSTLATLEREAALPSYGTSSDIPSGGAVMSGAA
jgi:dTDP-4-dehydrorhamnose 3,5-epimerase